MAENEQLRASIIEMCELLIKSFEDNKTEIRGSALKIMNGDFNQDEILKIYTKYENLLNTLQERKRKELQNYKRQIEIMNLKL